MIPAVEIYRSRFKQGVGRDTPYVMLGVNIVAADTDEEARWVASSGRQAVSSLRAGTPIQLPPPSREWEKEVVPFDPSAIERLQSISMVGAPETIRRGLESFVERLRPDELIVVSHIYDHAARLRSYEIVADVCKSTAGGLTPKSGVTGSTGV